jgi:hypothetical protein
VCGTAPPSTPITITLDDFSAPLSGTNISFSSQFPESDLYESELLLGSGVTATWSDSGDGILGGTRGASARAVGDFFSMMTISDLLSANGGGLDHMEEIRLSYSFSPLNLFTHHFLKIDGLSMDSSAQQGVVMTLTIQDGQGVEAVATLPFASLSAGRNVYDLSQAENWDHLDKAGVVSAQIVLSGTLDAADYDIDGVSFSASPSEVH